MKYKALKPIRENPRDWDDIQAEILYLFKTEIYLPALKALMGEPAPEVLKNSYADVVDALASGKLQYTDGRFSGQINAAISKELRRLGAKWKSGAWHLPDSDLTYDMRSALAIHETRAKAASKRVESVLQNIDPATVAGRLSVDELIDRTIHRTETEFRQSVKNVAVAPQLSPDQIDRIRREYTENLQLAISEFTEKETAELRKQIQASALQGFRYDRMVKVIQDSYGVSQRKAKFLARQETSLLMTKYKQVRYQDAGINEYRWQTVAGSADHPVRPFHARNNGQVFRWDQPPIVDENGNRKNPGQDYNCRCAAVPLVRF